VMAERKKVPTLFTWQAESLKVPTVLKAFVVSFWVYVVARVIFIGQEVLFIIKIKNDKIPLAS
jgi:hypothetical protein